MLVIPVDNCGGTAVVNSHLIVVKANTNVNAIANPNAYAVANAIANVKPPLF